MEHLLKGASPEWLKNNLATARALAEKATGAAKTLLDSHANDLSEAQALKAKEEARKRR